jgi:hypothetical protein
MSELAVSIQASGVVVTPGSSATFTVEVRNLGTVVERYRCEIVGMDPGWLTVTPASLELFPRHDEGRARADAPPSVGRFTVTLHPPRLPLATAGPWPIGAKVTSEHDPSGRVVEETTVAILPFGALDATLHPSIASGRRGADATVQVTNQGNRPEAVTSTGPTRPAGSASGSSRRVRRSRPASRSARRPTSRPAASSSSDRPIRGRSASTSEPPRSTRNHGP